MALLRTARIAAGSFIGAAEEFTDTREPIPRAPQLGYIVPPGKRAVIRHIDAAIDAVDIDQDDPGNCQLYVTTSSGLTFYLAYLWFIRTNYVNWSGHCVLNPSDRLYAFGSKPFSFLSYQASGAILDIPSAR